MMTSTSAASAASMILYQPSSAEGICSLTAATPRQTQTTKIKKEDSFSSTKWALLSFFAKIIFGSINCSMKTSTKFVHRCVSLTKANKGKQSRVLLKSIKD